MSYSTEKAALIADAERDDVRRTAVQLLLRLYRSELLASTDLHRHAAALDLPIEPEDLRSPSDPSSTG